MFVDYQILNINVCIIKLIIILLFLGLDLDCGAYYTENVEAAVRQGKVREADIDKSLNFLCGSNEIRVF